MSNAIRIRKILGGGMRQGGFLAAAGLYALENNINRLAEDHKKAIELEVALTKSSFVKKVEPVETNIVIFELNDKYSEKIFLEALSDKNIKIIGMGSNKLRLVTHLNYDDNQHDRVLEVISKL